MSPSFNPMSAEQTFIDTALTFARALGFSFEFISLLEADKRAPSLATLNKIAAYLKKDIRAFLQEKEGAFNILLRGDALKAPGSESLDLASQAVLERFKR